MIPSGILILHSRKGAVALLVYPRGCDGVHSDSRDCNYGPLGSRTEVVIVGPIRVTYLRYVLLLLSNLGGMRLVLCRPPSRTVEESWKQLKPQNPGENEHTPGAKYLLVLADRVETDGPSQ